MQPAGILETILYARDLDAIETFYADVLEMTPFSKMAGRQLFYRCGGQVLLIFNPDATVKPPAATALPVPPHGAVGPGHICFAANAREINAWRERLEFEGCRDRSRLHLAGLRRTLDLLPRPGRQLPRIRRTQDLGTALMPKLQRGTRLVVASHNPGKIREINDLIRPFGLTAVSAGELGVSEPEETEATFAGNARLKAVHSANATGLPALSDDSGLEVDALGGAPGIYSARWAGSSKDFDVAMKLVADKLTACGAWAGQGPRANFTAALCLACPTGETQVFEGRVFGQLVWPPRGSRGFGYDPMFIADGQTLTFGEMEPDKKHAISHRARAFTLFVAECLA